MAGEFDYPYPLNESQEAEAERLAAQRERRRRIVEVIGAAELVLRAIGTAEPRRLPEWGTEVRQEVILELRDDFPDYEQILQRVTELQTGRVAGQVLDDAVRLSALERAERAITKARRAKVNP
jgi:regulator of protease activity HflC (stomatin/prohibitin superfamily)